ncbi:Chalcone-flavanone isomerase family protein [Prunus dulcis]|uniref:Chalcone-flavonone isomerase family protein n=1 Tax=Prunus dulcis TaxID=3755 RepID=A0A4Y1RC48_PRUDU|nr:Chalcone-flavanone isomerase family protein [Prunus dulcis]
MATILGNGESNLESQVPCTKSETECRLAEADLAQPIKILPRVGFVARISNPNELLCQTHSCSFLSPPEDIRTQTRFTFNASSSSEYIEEPATKVRFQTSLSLPGCSISLSLLGTGYREKVFAIIGVKVYAAGLYVNQSILNSLNAWKGRSAAEIQEDSSLFSTIFQSPLEKSLQIVLVRDVDGKTFWDALNDAISPRIKSPTPVDESALSTFRNPSKMLVCISADGLPSSVDAAIESENVALALFDVFFGDTPVSPSLKSSVVNGLESVLNKLQFFKGKSNCLDLITSGSNHHLDNLNHGRPLGRLWFKAH